MKSHITKLALVAALTGSSVFGAEAAAAKPVAPASFTDSLTKGKVSVNARLRYEHVEQDGLEDADALTIRLRLGYTTQLYKGFQASIQGESVTPIAKDYPDGTPTSTTQAAVFDPEVYHLNQAWVSYTFEDTSLKVGRQVIILDNARFVGDVGWRQNDQTFDAALLTNKSIDKLTLTYAYIDYVNRIYDDSAPQPDFDSNSHLINAAYSGLPIGTLTAYGYLLDFNTDIAASKGFPLANSTATYGLSLVGKKPLAGSKDWKVLYRAEYATQTDYANSPLDYRATYYDLELGGAYKAYSLTAGYEVLGSDNGTAFKTPLATLHAFNGWADKFIGTPAKGLTDTYLKFSAPVCDKVNLLAFYHRFGTDEGPSYIGDEIDLQLAYKINKNFTVTGKVAKYNAEEATNLAGAFPAGTNKDTSKVWLQVDYTF
jgi:hypothetical protein